MKTIFLVNMVILICLFSAASLAGMEDSGYRVRAGSQEFQVEIAATKEQRRLGLMHREHLPASHGLLMVFKRDVKVPIWMKNVLFQLDVIWLSSDGVVVDIKTLPKCQGAPCPIYRSRHLARYVLEVGAGLFPLNRGDKVEIIDASGDSLLPSASDLELYN